MCRFCGKPNYVPCNCIKAPIASAPVVYCETKLDVACIFYNYNNPASKNGLNNLNLPNNTSLKTIIDQIDALLRKPGPVTPTPTPAPIQDIYVAVDGLDPSGNFLSDKLTAGDNVTFIVLNPGTNESIQISALNNQVATDANSTPGYLIDEITGGTDSILTLTTSDANGTVLVTPTLNITALLKAIMNLPNYQNAFCQLVNACFPPPVPPPVPPPPPCNAPTNLTASIVAGIVTLNWTPAGGSGTQVVQYKLNTQPSFGTYGSVGPTVGTDQIPGLTPNVVYNFNVYNNCGNGQVSTGTQVSAIQINCPTVTLTSTTTSITAQFPALGGDINSYLVLLLNAAGNSVITSQLIGPPFANPISVVFTGLPSGTAYNVQLQPTAGTITSTNCALSPIATAVLPSCVGPSNLNLTLSGSNGIGVTWTADIASSFQSLYYGLTSGITGNPPGNGWTAFSGNPLESTANSAIITGLTEGDEYSVALNSTCQNSNVTPFLTKELIIPLVIAGSIVLEAGSSAGAHQSNVKLMFTFDTPTPVPLTLYLGKLEHNSIDNTHFAAAGYSFFPLPAGYSPDTFYGPDPSVPFVVDVPVNSSTLTVTPIKQVNPGTTWQYGTATPNDEQLTDIYITAHSPSGVTVNFTLTQSPNTGTVVTIHNINS
jgi:hypothetical protein